MASLLLTLFLCSAGSLLTDLLLGRFDLLFAYLLRPGFHINLVLDIKQFRREPFLLDHFLLVIHLILFLLHRLHSSTDKLGIGISAWVIVYYVPFLLPVVSSPPLHNIAVLLKEIYRLRKVIIFPGEAGEGVGGAVGKRVPILGAGTLLGPCFIFQGPYFQCLV